MEGHDSVRVRWHRRPVSGRVLKNLEIKYVYESSDFMSLIRKSKTPRGGAGRGQGRKPGSRNRMTILHEEAAKDAGLTPLQYMLQVLRDPQSPPRYKMWAAEKSIKYVNRPMPVAVEVTDPTAKLNPQSLLSKAETLSTEQLEALVDTLEKLGAVRGDL